MRKPPAHRLREVGDEMMKQVVLQVLHEHLPAFAREDPFQVRPAVLQMVQNVGDLPGKVALFAGEVVGIFLF